NNIITVLREVKESNLNKERDNDHMSIGPILSLELKGLDFEKYPLINSPINLSVRTQFTFWETVEHYLKEYER
ncbi:7842_t:CDS:2, partial [Funneliformis caledonium]